MGYTAVRGPNLAISVIGETIYTNSPTKGFYKLVQPTDISTYGTIYKERYLGNRNKLPTLQKGDIVFGAERNIGKCLIICNELENAVTNYHGMSITTKDDKSLIEKIFIGLFILYLREKNYFEYYSVDGQGGSFGKEKTENIIIPCFSNKIINILAKLYHNDKRFPNCNSIAEFQNVDELWTKKAGIFELNEMVSKLKIRLNLMLDCIVNNESVIIDCNFENSK